MLDRLDIITRLLQDHVTTRRVMVTLEGEVDRVAQFHAPDTAAIDTAVGFFTGYMAEMHHPIEDMIYSALAREAPAQAAEIKKVADEHNESGALVSQLTEVAAELSIHTDRARASFCRVARGLIAFQRHHMRREESGFFRYAGELLTPATWRGINITAKGLEKNLADAASGNGRLPGDENARHRSRRRAVALQP